MLPIFRQHTGERSTEVATALLYRARPTEWLGDLDAALRDYEAALAIAEPMGAPGAPLRLMVLFNTIRVQCKRGAVAQARETAELARSALDLESEDGKTWAGRFEQALGFCQTGG